MGERSSTSIAANVPCTTTPTPASFAAERTSSQGRGEEEPGISSRTGRAEQERVEYRRKYPLRLSEAISLRAVR